MTEEPKGGCPQKLLAYLTHGGDWHATEERNFRPGMLEFSKDICTPYIPEALAESRVREARAKAFEEAAEYCLAMSKRNQGVGQSDYFDAFKAAQLRFETMAQQSRESGAGND